MPEYISKKKALKLLTQMADEAQKDADENGGESIIYAECLEDVIAYFERLPVEYSARFVPVTRRKDCKYSCCISDSRYCAHCNYPFADCEVDDNFYCAYGARMDGDAERRNT